MKVVNVLCSVIATSAVLGQTSANDGSDTMIEVYMTNYGPVSMTVGPQGSFSVVEIPGIDISDAMILGDDFIDCYFMRLRDEDFSSRFSSAEPLTSDFEAADRLYCFNNNNNNNESEVDGKKAILHVKSSRPSPGFITTSIEPQHDLSYVNMSGVDISRVQVFTRDAMCFFWRETVNFSLDRYHASFVSVQIRRWSRKTFSILGVDRLYCLNDSQTMPKGSTFLLLVENEAGDQDFVRLIVPSWQVSIGTNLSPGSSDYPEIFEKASRVAIVHQPFASGDEQSYCALQYSDPASPPGILSDSSTFLILNPPKDINNITCHRRTAYLGL